MIWWCIAAAFGAGLLAGGLAGLLTASRTIRAASVAPGNASSEAKLRSLGSQISSALTAQEELREAVEGLLNREKMRRVRQGAKVSSEPDPFTDPSAWKAHMRRARALGG